MSRVTSVGCGRAGPNAPLIENRQYLLVASDPRLPEVRHSSLEDAIYSSGEKVITSKKVKCDVNSIMVLIENETLNGKRLNSIVSKASEAYRTSGVLKI